MNEPSSGSHPLRVLLVVFAGSAVVAGIVATVAFLALDRYDGARIEVVTSVQPTIAVQVRGAVASPGVVELPAGARLVDAIAATGGLTGDADASALNLAARVGDGEALSIPSRMSATPEGTSIGQSTSEGKININTATAEQLDTLPGIGPVLSERIVAYRETHGPFQSIESLTQVDGISDKLLEDLRPLVTIDG